MNDALDALKRIDAEFRASAATAAMEEDRVARAAGEEMAALPESTRRAVLAFVTEYAEAVADVQMYNSLGMLTYARGRSAVEWMTRMRELIVASLGLPPEETSAGS